MKTDLSRVIMRFTYILSFFMFFIACIILLFSYILLVENEKKENQQNIQLITKYLEKYDRVLSSTATDIFKNNDFRENLRDYYLLSTTEYMAELLSNNRSPTFLIDTLKTLITDDEVKNISISLDYEKYLTAYSSSKIEKTSFTRSLNFISTDMPDVTLKLDISLNSLKKSLFQTHYNYILSNGINHSNLTDDENTSKSKKIQSTIIGSHTLRVYEKPTYYLQSLGWLSAIIFFIMSLFILAINKLLKKSFSNYIQQYTEIITSLEHSAVGEYQPINIETKSGDLNEIAQQINQFYIKNSIYQETLSENTWLKKEAQYSALQHQIEPHFLFNNLEFIRMQAVLNDDEETSDSIYLLSQLYRNNTYQSDMITVHDELTNIDLYLQLHQRRYPQSFQYKISDQVPNLLLPKLSLQPFIENYIKHGFDSSKKNNHLSVSVTQSTNRYLIHITDNGKGMDTITHDTIYEKLKNDIPYNENIGISNSIRRIKHLYPNKTEFTLSSQLNLGTSIMITIQEGAN